LGFVGWQAAIILTGVVVGYVLGWEPKFAADTTIAVQMFFSGFALRGWLEGV
jgi:hypothetical protein